MRLRSTLLLTAILLALPAFESAGHEGTHGPTRLKIAVSDGHDVKRAKLRCVDGENSVTGFLRRRSAHRLCAYAEKISDLLQSPEDDPNVQCLQVYGSAHTARVRGRVAGVEVDRYFHRHDGCGIADWSNAKRLLGGDPRGPATSP